MSNIHCRTMSLAIVFLGATLLGAPSRAASVSVSDPRPVAAAVQQLEARFGWLITYEDPPYVNSYDVADGGSFIKPGVSRPADPAVLRVPRGGNLSVAFASDGGVSAAVAALAKSFNDGRGIPVFAVSNGAGLVHLVPQKIAGLAGSVQAVTPVLDTPITLEAKEQSAYGLIQEIVRAVSANTGGHVVMGTTPANLLSTKRTSIAATQEPARSVLDRLFLDLNARLTWFLFYDPGLKWYVLNITVVPSAAKT